MADSKYPPIIALAISSDLTASATALINCALASVSPFSDTLSCSMYFMIMEYSFIHPSISSLKCAVLIFFLTSLLSAYQSYRQREVHLSVLNIHHEKNFFIKTLRALKKTKKGS